MSEFKVGDRVRYVPRKVESGQADWADVWQRRAERDSIVVGLPDDNGYPTQYRLVSIFEPGEETTWSDRDFWYAPAERLQRSEPEGTQYSYCVWDTTRYDSKSFDTAEEGVADLQKYKDMPDYWVIRRRPVGQWEDVK